MSMKRDCDGEKSKTQEHAEFVDAVIKAWEHTQPTATLKLATLNHPAARYNYTRDLDAPPPPVDPRNLAEPDVYVPEHLRFSTPIAEITETPMPTTTPTQ